MANALTGDFDVVAEFAVPAANRVLAAMHRSERFLHSLSVSVNDNPPPGPRFPWPIIVGAVDAFGDPVANQQRIGNPNPFPGAAAATNPLVAALDSVVNVDVMAPPISTIVPSHLSGKAQLQLSPPTVDVPDASGTNVAVHIEVMSRYFPDKNTSPLAEFIRGELQITAAVSQVASQVGNVLDINFKADSASIYFSPAWTSQPLSADDLAGISLMIKNGLRTSFLPSNVTLPSNIRSIQFKTLQNPQNALAILLNIASAPGNPASMNDVFLGGGDDFGFAVGVDYIHSVLQPIINNMLTQTYSTTVPVDVWYTTYHVTYLSTLSSATLDLQNGKIVLTFQGKAKQTSNKWYAPDNFTFTAQLSFTLQPDGDTADLVPGDISFNSSSWIINLFQGDATSGMAQVRDQALKTKDANGIDTYTKVNQVLSATGNLGGLLDSLLAPARTPGRRMPIRFFRGYKLAYTSVVITPAGITLHGTLTVTDWPAPFVEFEQIPATSSGGLVNAGDLLANGPDFSALKSWIPGGTIQQFEWSTQGQSQPFLIDDNKFVLIHQQTELAATAASTGAVAAYSPLCLTIHGTRLSSSGPVVGQPVSGTICGFNSFPVVSGLNVSVDGPPLLLALALSNPRGRLVVVGHTSAQLGQAGSGSANRLVHFADDATAASLEFLTRALAESKRNDAVTAVIAVLTSDQLAKASYAAGVIYAEDRGGAWEAAFRMKTASRPLTLIVGPKGNILWQKEGTIDSAALAAALRQFLVSQSSVKLGVLRSNLRIGQPVPNFLFQSAANEQLTLRKLVGRPCALVFWKSSLKPSIDAVRDLQDAAGKAGASNMVVLAINDGETADVAKKAASENGLTVTLVTDPNREISVACGINAWPTTVFTDVSGLVTAIRCGRQAADPTQASPA